MSTMWDSRAVPAPTFVYLSQLWDDWTSQGRLGTTLSPETCFLLGGVDGGQQYCCMLQSASFSRWLRKPQTHHVQLRTSLSFTRSKLNCGSEDYLHTLLGRKVALPGRWHAEGSYRGTHCWIDWNDKKRTSALCGLDYKILYRLPVLFLHFGQSCIRTPRGSLLALLHCKGFISGADQYLCAYLKPFFNLKWPLSSGPTFLWGRFLRFVCVCLCFSKLLLKKSKIVHSAFQQGLKVLSKGRRN